MRRAPHCDSDEWGFLGRAPWEAPRASNLDVVGQNPHVTEVESGIGAKALAGAQETGQEPDDADNHTWQIDAGRGSGRERALHCDGTAGHTMPNPGDVDVPRPVS
ncbi:MAG: hypothetical protein ACPIOQ_80640, partial [Promethearchaeia archaeon]